MCVYKKCSYRSIDISGCVSRFGGLGSIGKEISFHTGPLDLMGAGAGDRNPYLEMEITWTPEGDMEKKTW